MPRTKEELIKILVQDFKDTTPNYTQREIKELTFRLGGFDVIDLELLASQLTKEEVHAQRND